MRGLTIIGVTLIHDYAQILFDSEGILSVFSPITVKDGNRIEVADLSYLIGRNIRQVTFEYPSLTLLLDNNGLISIQCDTGYNNNPEALTYSSSGNAPLCVVQKT
jgi:hypothetical protein